MIDDGGRTGALVTLLISATVVFCGGECRSPSTTLETSRQPKLTTTRSAEGLPRTSERAAERRRMVESQLRDRGIRDRRVLEAMRDVPRHWFVPASVADAAYDDGPLPIGWGQTISQPYIVGLMTELLRIGPEDKVLEIGTGSGYQAAVLAELTRHVYTIEIVEPLAKRTMQILKERGYETIHVRIGDGYAGWPEEAPFDAIIVTCAPESPPEALVKQLAAGGRMCVPVGPEGGVQELVLLRKQQDGRMTTERIAPVRFVPMVRMKQQAP